jgi:hypothetical protein
MQSTAGGHIHLFNCLYTAFYKGLINHIEKEHYTISIWDNIYQDQYLGIPLASYPFY